MIRIQPFTNRLVEEFCTFSRKYYDNFQTTDPAFVRWKFPENGRFSSEYLTCENQETVVGRAMLCRRPLTCGDQELTINQPSDLLIDPSVSNAATLLQMVNAYPQLKTHGLVHTSNAASEAIYKGLFKFPIVTELRSVGIPVCVETILPRKIALLPLRVLLWIVGLLVGLGYQLLTGIVGVAAPRFKVVEGAVTSDCVDLLDRFRRLAPCQVTRDQAFVDWRYVASPYAYRELNGINDEDLISKIIYRIAEYEGTTSLTIMDWLVARELTLAEKARCIAGLRKIARQHKAAMIYYLGNFRNPAIRQLFNLSFLPIPDRVLPHSSPIFAYEIKEPLTEAALRDMYLTLGDLDYF